jgi:sugar/nucleoside kinase (ribokinase family)
MITLNREGTAHDLVAIGNAIVDVLAQVEEEFLTAEGMNKGHMEMVDASRMAELMEKLRPIRQCSGGSAANTAAALAQMGNDVAFIGRVCDDAQGALFLHDMHALGIAYDTPPAATGKPTAGCLVCVTPDAERTMSTYIGASAEITPADIDARRIESSAILYVEGYLWDEPHAKDALRFAINTAKAAHRKVALTLSDTFCVNRHRAEFLELIRHDVDILFANEHEAKALFETENMSVAVRSLLPLVDVAVVTQSEQGAILLHRQEEYYVPAEIVADVVDTTGAGDLFAAGFLHGLLAGWNLQKSARLGHRCAARIIGQIGARAEHGLTALLSSAA